jgi:predicted Fe-Mo cluster-binding NifX family protein
MRIAVATDDGINISEHFGRSEGFIIFDVIDNQATKVEQRTNTNHHEHAQGDCEHHGREEGHQSHESFLSALHDCQAVICRGMGRRAVIDLSTKGIKPAIISQNISALEAVTLYAKGDLKSTTDSQCCSH